MRKMHPRRNRVKEGVAPECNQLEWTAEVIPKILPEAVIDLGAGFERSYRLVFDSCDFDSCEGDGGPWKASNLRGDSNSVTIAGTFSVIIDSKTGGSQFVF